MPQTGWAWMTGPQAPIPSCNALVWVKKEDAPGKGSVRVMANGQPAGADTFAFASTDAPPNKGYLLGTRLNDTAHCTPVEVFEVILHDRALNDSEIEALNRYLQREIELNDSIQGKTNSKP